MKKKVKIVNRIVSRKKALKMYDKGYLPTFIVTKGKEDDLDDLYWDIEYFPWHTDGSKYYNAISIVVRDCDEDTVKLSLDELDDRDIKPTELIMSKSKSYPIKKVVAESFKSSYGDFICKTDKNKKRTFSMEYLFQVAYYYEQIKRFVEQDNKNDIKLKSKNKQKTKKR